MDAPTNHAEREAHLAGTLTTFDTLDDALDFAQYGDAGDFGLQAAAEIAAENAWLRAAEYDPEAEAFERWEADRGVIPFDVAFAEAVIHDCQGADECFC